MSRDTDMGIYLKDQKKFYYLEAGDNYIANTVDRIRKTLVQRNLLPTAISSDSANKYYILSIKDAKDKEYNFEPIFISKHMQEIYKQKELKASNTKGFKS